MPTMTFISMFNIYVNGWLSRVALSSKLLQAFYDIELNLQLIKIINVRAIKRFNVKVQHNILAQKQSW